jgi:hypothetical protein
MISTSSALFHASVFFASTFIDGRSSTQYLTQTPEVLAHNGEAIQQINLELSQDNLSDAIILAILTMAKAPEETALERQKRMELNNTSPFKLTAMPPQWHESFIHISLEDVHFSGARTIINLRGGVQTLTSPCTAKTLSL